MTHRDAHDAPAPRYPGSGLHRRTVGGGATDEAENLIRRGDACLERNDPASAAEAFVQALELLKAGDPKPRARAYARLGDANRAMSRTFACLHSYRQALAEVEGYLPALEGLLALHVEWREWEAVRRTEEELFDQLEGDALARALLMSGDRWWRRAARRQLAFQRYSETLQRFPGNERARVRLRALASNTAPPPSARGQIERSG